MRRRFPGLIMWAGSVTGPLATPGKYQVRLTVDGKSQTQNFAIMKDPRLDTTPEDYAKQLTLALQISDKLTATNDGCDSYSRGAPAIGRIRQAR